MLYGVNCSCFSRCVVLGGTFGDGKAIEQFRLFIFIYYEKNIIYINTPFSVFIFLR